MSKKKKKIRKNRTAGSPTWMVAGNLSFVSQREADAWKDRTFHSGGTNSAVRRIDPNSGEVVTADVLETLATAMLKADKKVVKPRTRNPRKARKESPTTVNKENFYASWQWKELRFQVLKLNGRACQCCGATAGTRDAAGKPVKIVVDHIKPISKFWELRLQRTNLQVLCDECNMGKGAWDETDFRALDKVVHASRPDNIDKGIIEQLTDRTTGRLQ